MEDGFKLFTGGVLEKILKETTRTVTKAIFSGFAATAVVQSSSLVSVIAISFLTAELIALPQAIGIIFGSNIGTTVTAWLVSAFGLKINIAHYAMPMLVFGVLLRFSEKRSYKGLGNILLGLGFIFLGISFMKDGFETLRSGIDLSRYALGGIAGIGVYVFIGALATVIIQSSSATMALIITAVASGQIEYVNSISLAIGANIGSTVTAILGALTSNENGKRLAVAHLVFNVITALFAVVFIYPLIHTVDFLSGVLGVSENDIAIKLTLFHTLFNVAGVLLVTPFIDRLVRFLNTLFIFKGERRGKPRYLDGEVVKASEPALVAVHKETEHLYDNVSEIILRALYLRADDVYSQRNLAEVVGSLEGDSVDINKMYIEGIKNLYSSIIYYSTIAEQNMDDEERRKIYKLKLACRNIINAIKDIREIEKNIRYYRKVNNPSIKEEYNFLRENIAEILRDIDIMRNNPNDETLPARLEKAQERSKSFDVVTTKRLSDLLRDDKIGDTMATSLMNDGVYTTNIIQKLIGSATVLWLNGGVLNQATVEISLQESVT
jgi:phosphate:Na+ symporter